MTRIKHLNVIDGVHWVEIPDAGLSVLCACPADSVKHLIQKGLILATERDGVAFETGPNAILLSDFRVQNGHFCNLGEFPVLQMLYHQGMILPDHPNNTGAKPLVIGAEDQIKAQMEYIYRGNYGLISEEEMIAAGADPAYAREMMSLKRRFAFGEITDSEELLDSVVVNGDEPVEIRNGVAIRRTAPNVFEFSFQGDVVEVDLNLPAGGTYRSPYPLGFQKIGREYFSIVHSGQGDGWDVNRPAVGSVLIFQGQIYLIDAGPTLAYTLTALGIGVNEIAGVFITHAHDDHFAGLTTLIRADHRKKFFATPLVRASVMKKMSALLSAEEESFHDYFEVHDLEVDAWNSIAGFEVRPTMSPHPVETTIFTFRTYWEEGYLSYAHNSDTASFAVLEDMVVGGDAPFGITAERLEQVRSEYLEPATVKKIDIGGGLIHGVAEDYEDDKSERIILSHTAVPLTPEQKVIGSSAPFGTTDVLISDRGEMIRQTAITHLQAYFKDPPEHSLQALINSIIVTFKPGSIVLGEGEKNEFIYLMLSGIAERLKSGESGNVVLTTGEFLGEFSGLHGFPSDAAYRTVSYVQALKIPRKLYLHFVRENRLYRRIERLAENRNFLQTTWLFGESLSCSVQNRIAESMELSYFFEENEDVGELDDASIYLVKDGAVRRRLHGGPTETLRSGEFFGEEIAIFRAAQSQEVTILEPAGLYRVPCQCFVDIPIIRWKLFEAYGKHV